MTSIRILLSDCHDPHFNLAVEDAIFRNMEVDKRILFLWRNADTVVIGKGQNPWKECNTAKMEQDGVKLARRQSGGGAVFHDLGNTNFTFMGSKPNYDKSVSTAIVLAALKQLGIDGKSTGRNDLVVEIEGSDRKFSGSAYRDLKDRGFHHGTLLLSADLSRLADYLNPDPKKLQAKGITSVRARVTNLSDVLPGINHATVCSAIQNEFMKHFEDCAEPEIINEHSLPDLPGFSEIYEKQKDWNWNFGRAPSFSHLLDERFEWGGVELHLDVQNGVVKSSKIFTDSLYPDLLEQIAIQMQGRRYDAVDLSSVVSNAVDENPDRSGELHQFATWLNSALL